VSDLRTGDAIEVLAVDAQTGPEPTRVVVIGDRPLGAIAALRGAGFSVVVSIVEELAPRINPALLIAMLEPVDLPLVRIHPKHKPTRAEWRRAMKGGR
jgi:beta-phosphoglucomutase-like phosphatase (HAD superfamily)